MDLSVDIAGVKWKNPVTTASGTFASGREYADFIPLKALGAITTKGVSLKRWAGNEPPRISEVYGGMLNSVGLQNPGVEAFIQNDLPFLANCGAKVIVNVAGHTVDEYRECARRLDIDGVDMLELNISCPNIREGGMVFGTNPKMAEEVVRAVKRVIHRPLIVKLSPNVTDIDVIAKACECAGADALSLINTVLGLKIDIYSRKPILGNIVGGLSGPAIKPIAIRCVYTVANSVDMPIIGMGGIMTGDDAVEFLLAGASAVAVGTANFTKPNICLDIIEGMSKYMEINGEIRRSYDKNRGREDI